MHNPADHASVIDPRLDPCVGRQQRFQPCELSIGRPKQIANYEPPLAGSMNHERPLLEILIGPEPRAASPGQGHYSAKLF
jgi:hypothetical protein